MQKLFFTSLFTTLTGFLFSQQFGGNPPSTNWNQLNSDTARIIFPKGLDLQAQRVASVIHFLAAKDTTLGNKLRKINVVLQNQTTIANAYVGLGPFRSEFFMTPSMNNFDIGSIDWAEQLALHEYRHVQQFNNFKTGLSKFISYLFGEDGYNVAISAAVPGWFYEGDAVYNETVFSEQGRGRIPFFTNQYKSLWLGNKNYSWMKLRNGSFKDYVPNHYPLGYLLVNYGYEKYGTGFWENVTKDAVSYKGLFYPFQKAVKRNSGISYKSFRDDAFTYYMAKNSMVEGNRPELPESENSNKQKSPKTSSTDEKNITEATTKYVTNYYFPYQSGNGSFIYLKSSYRKRPKFFIKNDRIEKILRVKDISLDEQFSFRNNKIVYAAYKPDIRWSWKNYSDIRLVDVNSGSQKKLTLKAKYFTPDINEDGTKIVAVDYEPTGKCELHILDAASGNILQRISEPDVSVFTDPKFINDHSLVCCARYTDGRIALIEVEISTGEIKRLTPASFNAIGFPSVDKDKIYFTISYNGNDQVFLVQLSDKKIFQLTGSNTGNYFANGRGSKLIYSNFTADGYQLKETELDDSRFIEVDPSSLETPAFQVPIANQSYYKKLLPGTIPSRNFEVNKYRKGTRLINFHSWWPTYEDPEFTFTLYGQNILNTLQTEFYYLYNQDEKTNSIGFGTTYGALFPYLSAGAEYTFNRTEIINNLTHQWNQLDSRIGFNIPINFSGGRYYRFLNGGSSYVFRIENNTGPNKNQFEENNFSYLSHFISYSQQLEMAKQDINPRFGYDITLQYRHAITKYDSYQFLSYGHLFLPGLFSTHSIVVDGAFQQRDTLRQLFSNRFPYSRGYNEFYFSRMWKWGVNYHFPLWLPDWGFANLLYINRIRANMFYDFTKVYSRNKKVTADQRSTGVEIYFDTKWWNEYPLILGFRVSKLLDNDFQTGTKGTVFEFVLPVSILPR